jgi:putative ABC transport system permease protein
VKTLIILAWRYLMGRKLRTALTTLEVVFGVAVVFGSNSVVPSILAALDSSAAGIAGKADLTVSSATGEAFGASVLDEVRGHPGVAAVSPSLHRTMNLPVAGSPAGVQLEVVGVDAATAGQVRPFQVGSGRFLQPGDDRAVVLSQSAAQALGAQTGGTSGPTAMPSRPTWRAAWARASAWAARLPSLAPSAPCN